ncbi:MAG: DUF2752 domain-containing protein [Ruminococcus sp.]|nr:DUF2752 domain-containing protein [uncultured Ruminococcus sp.]MBQ4262596.1 DUF2752 domain-containing protein [Ruminococcus sp.]SCX12800.1 Protein of unknown function [Ruminococcaceae bacterium P7]
MQYKRWQKALVIIAPFAAAAVCGAAAYLILRYVTLWPCPSLTLLHIYCPGCGSTRAVAALLHGDLLLALRQNSVIPVMLLMAVLYYLEFALKVWGVRFRFPVIHNKVFITALFVCWLIYAVVRNFVPAIAPIEINL